MYQHVFAAATLLMNPYRIMNAIIVSDLYLENFTLVIISILSRLRGGRVRVHEVLQSIHNLQITVARRGVHPSYAFSITYYLCTNPFVYNRSSQPISSADVLPWR